MSETHTLHLDELNAIIELDDEGMATLKLRRTDHTPNQEVTMTPEDYGDLVRFWDEVTKADG